MLVFWYGPIQVDALLQGPLVENLFQRIEFMRSQRCFLSLILQVVEDLVDQSILYSEMKQMLPKMVENVCSMWN